MKGRYSGQNMTTYGAVLPGAASIKAWSKYKIKALLEKEGVEVSESTVGRILKRKGLINKKASKKRRKAAKNPKKRFPKGFVIKSSGDMIQIDVKHIPLTGGRKHYQFTAIDVLSKKRVLDVYPSENSKNGERFLADCLLEFGFPVRAIQTDNGSTFQKHFAKYCEEENIPHYFIYPRSPKQNSYVESSHRADEFEFYRQGNVSSNLKVMRKRVKEWQEVWNNIRPHESLNYLTPSAYLEKYQRSKLPTKDVIVLQT